MKWRKTNLKEQRAHASHLVLLLHEDLEVLVDDGHGQQDTGAGTDGAHEVGQDRECSDAEATEGRGRRDVSVEFVDHGGLAVTAHHHLLLAKLLGNLEM